jgi:hypothetical protein
MSDEDDLENDDARARFGSILRAWRVDRDVYFTAAPYVALAFDRDDAYVDYRLVGVESVAPHELAAIDSAREFYDCSIERSRDAFDDGDSPSVVPAAAYPATAYPATIVFDFPPGWGDVRRVALRCKSIVAIPRYFKPSELSEIFSWLPRRCDENELLRYIAAIEAHGISVSNHDGVYRFVERE